MSRAVPSTRRASRSGFGSRLQVQALEFCRFLAACLLSRAGRSAVGFGFGFRVQDFEVPKQGSGFRGETGTALNLRTTTSHKCAAVPRRART